MSHGSARHRARIGYRLIEAAAHAHIGELRVYQENWNEAARELEEAIEIADDIGNPQVSRMRGSALPWSTSTGTTWL